MEFCSGHSEKSFKRISSLKNVVYPQNPLNPLVISHVIIFHIHWSYPKSFEKSHVIIFLYFPYQNISFSSPRKTGILFSAPRPRGSERCSLVELGQIWRSRRSNPLRKEPAICSHLWVSNGSKKDAHPQKMAVFVEK